jgi:hypothetical protein
MKSMYASVLIRQGLIGALLVLISLPLLWILHGTFKLGSPPLSGIIVLGGAVVISLALAGIIGTAIGESRGNPWVAALVGLLLGGAIVSGAAPLYGSMVVDGLTHDATGMVWNEREKIIGAARDVNLRDQLANLQRQAQQATDPQTRAQALEKAKDTARQLAGQGGTRGMALFKSGVARSTALALLFWAIVGPPLSAGFEARRAKR